MPNFIAAQYDKETKCVQYLTDDNRICIRSGGSLPWRTNNAGDLLAPIDQATGKPKPRKTKGWLNLAEGGEYTSHFFFIFPDYETGRSALRACLGRLYMNSNFYEFVSVYASKKDHNNEGNYVSQLVEFTGIDPKTKLRDMSEADLNKFMDAIERIEGYHRDESTRKETFVAVSTIHATDGRVPVAGEEIIVKTADGQEKTFTSSASGQFPPIVHGNGPTTIIHKTPDGEKKTIGTLPPDKGQHLSLLTKFSEFVGWSAPKKAPEDSTSKKAPLVHVVMPHDTLSKIAAKYDISVADIKQYNHLTSDTIFPGQRLGIHGTPPPLTQATPKKAAPKPSKTGTAGEKSAATKDVKKAPPAPESQTKSARSKEGSGEPIAMIQPEKGEVPWMEHAIAEGKRFHGEPEATIEKTMNYHKLIGDGLTSLQGTPNAWCAAFASWCLIQAGYPTKNDPDDQYKEIKIEQGRARAFLRTERGERDSKTKKIPLVPNPLYIEIPEPIYGAIALETGSQRSDIAKHVGFAYGKNDYGIILLGGNQSDRIKFAAFPRKQLKFCIPAAYEEMYKKYQTPLKEYDRIQLNKDVLGYMTVKEDEEAEKKHRKDATR